MFSSCSSAAFSNSSCFESGRSYHIQDSSALMAPRSEWTQWISSLFARSCNLCTAVAWSEVEAGEGVTSFWLRVLLGQSVVVRNQATECQRTACYVACLPGTSTRKKKATASLWKSEDDKSRYRLASIFGFASACDWVNRAKA